MNSLRTELEAGNTLAALTTLEEPVATVIRDERPS
jgi:hypothetical protein